MSEKQPEALRLADTFEGAAQMMEAASDDYFYKGAAELRRQHALLEEMAWSLRECLDDTIDAINRHVAEYGETYKPQRLQALRNQQAGAEDVLAKWEASK